MARKSIEERRAYQRERARQRRASSPDEVRAALREWRHNNRDKLNAQRREYRRRNPEKDRNAAKARRAANPPVYDAETGRRHNLKSKFNMTIEEYDALERKQGGLCALCQSPETVEDHRNPGSTRRLAVDHCHNTGTIRGLLCYRCNTSLGRFGDDPLLFRKAAEYLERHKQ